MEFELDLNTARHGKPLMTGDIGYDEYVGTLSPLGYAHLAALTKAKPGTFRYIRIHNIFSSKEGDNRGARDAGGDPIKIEPNGKISFNWALIDLVCEAIMSVGCIPFLELGFTPTPWSTMEETLASEPQGELKWKIRKNKPGSPACYPPKDVNLWNELVEQCLKHLLERFGESVHQWPVELWNEPDIGYFKGTVDQYCALWEPTYKTCKKYGMKIVGGPGLAQSEDFLQKYLEFCIATNSIPDYISYHVKAGHEPDLDKGGANTFVMWSRFLRLRDAIPRNLRHLPIWITEFDPITGCENGIVDGANWAFHNQSYYAAWLGKMCYMLVNLQQSIGVDDQEVDEDIEPAEFDAIFNDNHHITAETAPFYGARCLTTPICVERQANPPRLSDNDPIEIMQKKIAALCKNAVDHPSFLAALVDVQAREYTPKDREKYERKVLVKPIFRAMELTRNLMGKYLSFSNPRHDIYGVLSYNNNEICIVIVNQSDPIAPSPPTACSVKINHFQGIGLELVESARIDSQSANPYEVWKNMSSPHEISLSQWNELELATQPKPAELTDLTLTSDEISFKIHMEGHSFHYLKFLEKK